MNILIIGSGYVGLVTGACFADLGHQVTCMDSDSKKIDMLKRGEMPIFEPGLEGLVQANAAEGRLIFTDTLAGWVSQAEVIFISVPTPPKENGEADLTYIENVAKDLAHELKHYVLIVEKSTVPVQTASWLVSVMKRYIPSEIDFDVASNPEFLREGTALHDFMNPDRIVIGTDSDRAAQILVKLYEPLNAPLLITDIESAELIKHAANAFLAMKISFINAIAQVCERTKKADVVKVAKGIGLDPRIGLAQLSAGAGYGGACLPKDIQAFIHISQKLGYDFQLLKVVEEINQNQRSNILGKVRVAAGGSLKGKRIGVLGLTFKPNTDDIRGAPSIEILENLLQEGALVQAYDPKGMDKVKQVLPDISYVHSSYQAAEGADVLLILTEWEEFRRLHLPKLKALMRQPAIVDGRNIFEPAKMRNLGFTYRGIGRG